MEHIAAFMLLVGCNADATTCQEIPVPVAAYENVAECDRELAIQIRLGGAGQERVYGACKEIDEEAFEQSATIDWSISRSGKLIVTFEAEPQVVAAR
ncbi:MULTISPECIES: hypothetical protein [unclassified Aureimonas]|uniref:hypothetical protein n=1 Tax=unclassified Aureimonas TaxID=2615206 RepID=UPI0006FA6C86|nr:MULTISPECIES: hypothetical protein [unclassified Aureimonas]KQT64203.1 hypothetical protein ASG62_04210 [Aureimonas sp. Leaf427]KQT81392.1 hypothetical protein ASG54_01480 [Aureimonas sp. Leaf460]